MDTVLVDEKLVDYAMQVVAESRRSPLLALGVSTRGGISWYRAAQPHQIPEAGVASTVIRARPDAEPAPPICSPSHERGERAGVHRVLERFLAVDLDDGDTHAVLPRELI